MFTPPRSRINRTDLTQVSGQLLQALALASTAQLEGLQQTRDTQVALGALLETEAQRLQKKYGPDHRRVQQINTSLQRNAIAVKDLDVELELTTIRQPEVGDDAALVQGRVSDQSGQGIAGLVVFLGNEQRQPYSFLGMVETDRAGYFALVVSPAALGQLGQAAPNGVFLTVSTRQGKSVYHSLEPLQLQAGDRSTQEVTLDRNELSRDDSCPPVEPSPPVARDWLVQGRVTQATTGQGVAGVQVNAIDNNRRFDDKLGSAITDNEGSFRIAYDFHPPAGAAPGPDLYITVIDEGGQQLFTSQVDDLRRNAGRSEAFEVSLAPQTSPGATNLPLDGSVLWFEARSTQLRQNDERLDSDRLLRLALQRVQGFLRQNPNGQVTLRGYASTEDGNREEAQAISQRRAGVVQGLLVQSGIPAAQIVVTAAGLNTTYPDGQLNQRVELVLSASAPGGGRPIAEPVTERPVVDRLVTRPVVNRVSRPNNPDRS